LIKIILCSFLIFFFTLELFSQVFSETAFNSKTVDLALSTGSTSGVSGVSNGSASYTIPLSLPSGTNNISPEIAINYSSSGNSGILGFGWGLSGLSIITRVGQTNYYDNQIKPITLNTDDRFAIDGNRLLLMSGNYGSNNAIYATEAENFNRVESYGNISGAPEYFIQTTKEGIKMEYGGTVDSRKMNEGKIIFWKLNKVLYPDGNYIEYSYLDQELIQFTPSLSANLDQHRIDEIRYTGNATAGIVPYNKVKFHYYFKDHKNSQYEYGCPLNDFLNLIGIEIYAENVISKKYVFTYGNQSANTYLTEIKEIGSNLTSLNSTIFKYGATASSIPTSELTSSNFFNRSHFNGNINGDGKSDLILAYKTFQGFHNKIEYLGFTKNLSGLSQFIGASDFDGDGRDELVVARYEYYNTNYHLRDLKVYKLSSATFAINDSITINYPYQMQSVANLNIINISDYNGDGLADIFFIGSPNYNGSFGFYFTGNSISTLNSEVLIPLPQNTPYDFSKHQPTNFNGDNITDLLCLSGNGSAISNIINNQLVQLYFETGSLSNQKLIYSGDFNGDGKTDFLTRASKTDNNSQWSYCYGTGQGYQSYNFSWAPSYGGNPDINNYYGHGLYLSDFNGDGRSDILRVREQSGNSNSVFDLGYGGIQVTQSINVQLLYYDRSKESIYDVNGDGRSDIIQYINDNEGPRHVYFGKDSKETLLDAVKNGEGHITSFEYKKMTEKLDIYDDFYVRGDLSIDIVSNIQIPVWLVKTYKSQNGVGGYKTQSYKYENAKIHKNGKGILGFRKIINEDNDSYLRTISEYTFDNSGNTPLAKGTMLPLKITTEFVTGTPKFTETSFTFSIQNLTGIRYYQKALTTEVFNHYEGRKSLSENLLYDDFGNVKNQSVKLYHKLSNNTYDLIQTSSSLLDYNAFVTSIPNKVTMDNSTFTRKGEIAYNTTTKYEYTTNGQLEWKREFFGQSKHLNTYFSYHNHGSHKGTKLVATGMTDRYSEKTYDSKGRFVISDVDPLNNISSATYDNKWGRPLTLTGIDGLVTTMTYDEFGRLLTTLSPTGYTVTESYIWDINTTDKTIKYHFTTHPGKPNVKSWYDILGRVVKTEKVGFGGNAITQKTNYDQLGNIFSETTPKLSSETDLITSYTYESNYTTKRVKTVTTNVSSFGTTSYDYTYSQGLLSTKTISPANQEKTKITDVTGKIVSAIDHGGTLNYSYFSHGGIKEVKNGTSTQVSLLYDIYSRKQQMTDINAGITSYVYDAFGQLTNQTNANGQIHSYTYDNLGRVLTETMPEGVTTYEYFLTGTGVKIGKIKKITGFSGDIKEYDYDSYGRLIQEKLSFQGTTYFTDFLLNIYGDLTRTTYPTGLIINRYYDSNGYPTTVKNNGDAITLFTNNVMNGRNQIKQYTLGNTKQSTTSYFHGIPTGYSASGVQNLQMNWDYKSMNLMGRRDYIKNRIDTFTYDNLNRLTGYRMGTISGNTITLGSDNTATYLANGNINNKFDAGSYTYNSSKVNAVETVSNPFGNIPNTEQYISYNSMFQPSQINEGPMGSNRLDFTYGSDEQRIKSELKNGPTTTVYTRIHLGDYEINTQGGVTRNLHYISAGDGIVAIVEKTGSTYTYYYTYTDQLGSILTLTNSTGAIVTEQNFDPWGRRRNP
jgi:YD repeat-containing protein